MKPLNQLLHKCEKAIRKVQNGETTIDQFELWLVNLLRTMEPRAIDLREACSDEDWGPGREAAIEALDSYEEGFEECRQYLESEDGRHLEAALALMRHGTEFLNKAYEATVETDENPVISWIM